MNDFHGSKLDMADICLVRHVDAKKIHWTIGQ
jgi:hypothetical protein